MTNSYYYWCNTVLTMILLMRTYIGVSEYTYIVECMFQGLSRQTLYIAGYRYWHMSLYTAEYEQRYAFLFHYTS